MKGILVPGALLALALSGSVSAAEDNVHFSGALVSEPCTLPDADTDIHLDFGTVIDKYLYQYNRTKSQPFSIHLQDCDPVILNTVSVTFQGMADNELTTMLALDASSVAMGVVIGLEQADGKPMIINKPGPLLHLTPGNNTLNFNSFVQVKPSVLETKSLKMGEFTAVTTFVLAYQ
ncbi:fimbrial protein [Cronobacter dublinensis]|uniref:fimbrial protein n=1 Tax=Cronobacter dublinensis TaxID=413497 RepID=UPI000CFE1B8E|nr:fimbrial protein [Cronobacter dublinensis]EGT4379658.1 type 1 fimbrial protein [Cronobacter dublinensis]EKM6455979.1 fimbrial protein [Cronobacter dublinensis]EKY3203873.1 fimbrial protein [Cronobacter dublinensis]EKY3223803.1 fimbrial protein [Cronobacter dublinensis]EKY3244257.1 fimbrial protein [Cronobacter dublinensis]